MNRSTPTAPLLLLLLGGLLCAPLGVLDLAGARAHTTLLSGSVPVAGMEAVPYGIAYLVAWFVAWWIAPVFVLAAAGLWATARLRWPW